MSGCCLKSTISEMAGDSHQANPTFLVRCCVAILRSYKKFISPLLPQSCRFTPTCSEYAIEAVQQRGVIRGLLLACFRLLRCHPFAKGGYDPVK
jgi:hypothetical protein